MVDLKTYDRMCEPDVFEDPFIKEFDRLVDLRNSMDKQASSLTDDALEKLILRYTKDEPAIATDYRGLVGVTNSCSTAELAATQNVFHIKTPDAASIDRYEEVTLLIGKKFRELKAVCRKLSIKQSWLEDQYDIHAPSISRIIGASYLIKNQKQITPDNYIEFSEQEVVSFKHWYRRVLARIARLIGMDTEDIMRIRCDDDAEAALRPGLRMHIEAEIADKQRVLDECKVKRTEYKQELDQLQRNCDLVKDLYTQQMADLENKKNEQRTRLLELLTLEAQVKVAYNVTDFENLSKPELYFSMQLMRSRNATSVWRKQGLTSIIKNYMTFMEQFTEEDDDQDLIIRMLESPSNEMYWGNVLMNLASIEYIFYRGRMCCDQIEYPRDMLDAAIKLYGECEYDPIDEHHSDTRQARFTLCKVGQMRTMLKYITDAEEYDASAYLKDVLEESASYRMKQMNDPSTPYGKYVTAKNEQCRWETNILIPASELCDKQLRRIKETEKKLSNIKRRFQNVDTSIKDNTAAIKNLRKRLQSYE